MNAIAEFILHHPLVEILGWTVVHFLWQALVVALPMGIILFALRRATAQVRYVVACAGMLMLAALPVTTFFLQVQASNPLRWQLTKRLTETGASKQREDIIHWDIANQTALTTADTNGLTLAAGDPQADTNLEEPNIAASGPIGWQEFLETARWAPVVAGMWFAGVVLLSLRLLGGLWRVDRLRRRSQLVADPQLVGLFEELARRIKVRGPVKLLQSVESYVPSVIGFWRPVVIVPLSMTAGLTTAEVESILAHELAHVRRRDWFVNVVQSLIETLLFFHPVVWWISAVIRRERENCCDDVAVAVCGNRMALARALAYLEETRCAAAGLAMSASGGSLIQRIRRILLPSEHVPSARWTAGLLALATSVLLICGLWVSVLVATPNTMNADNARPVAAGAEENDLEEKPAIRGSGPMDDDWPRHRREVMRTDERTGQSHRVLAGVVLTGQEEKQAAVDMKYSNVFNYTFIPARVATELGAIDLGEIDFGDGPAPKHEELVDGFQGLVMDAESGKWVLKSEDDKSGDDSHQKSDDKTVSVNELTEPAGDRTIVPYAEDAVWIPGHLAFYGVNRMDQKRFRVVRIEGVNLTLGPEFGPVNALVLVDENSTLGVLGMNWASIPRGPMDEVLVWAASGDFYMMEWAAPETKDQEGIGKGPHTEDSAHRQNSVIRQQELLSVDSDETPWGRMAEHTGLQSRLTMQTENPHVGQPLLVKLELRNSGTKPASFDPQNYAPFRVLRVEVARPDLPPPFIGMKPQTSGQKQTLQPGEARTLWENVDVAELFLLAHEREYEVFAKGGEWANQPSWRDSNRLSVQLQPGTLPARQRLIAALVGFLPKDWTVNVGFAEIHLQHSPTNLKKDVTRLAIRFTKEKLADDVSVAWPVPGQDRVFTSATVLNLGETELGHIYLLGLPRQTEQVWPGYLDAINRSIDSVRNKTESDHPWQATGRVTDRDGRPLAGVTVSAHCGIGTLRNTGSAVTDADGRYELVFGPGIFSESKTMVQAATISISLDGHIEQNLHRQGDCVAAMEKPEGDDLGWGGKTVDDLFLPGQIKEINFVMVPATSLSGTILDEHGDPLDDVRVSLVGDEMPPSSSVVVLTRTDKGGRFVLPNIPSGYSWQLLIEPAKTAPPRLGWASPVMAFVPGEAGKTHIKYLHEGRDVDFCFDQLSVVLNGDGVNWKEALAGAKTQPLILKWDGLSTDTVDTVINAGIAFLDLGKQREQ